MIVGIISKLEWPQKFEQLLKLHRAVLLGSCELPVRMRLLGSPREAGLSVQLCGVSCCGSFQPFSLFTGFVSIIFFFLFLFGIIILFLWCFFHFSF